MPQLMILLQGLTLNGTVVSDPSSRRRVLGHLLLELLNLKLRLENHGLLLGIPAIQARRRDDRLDLGVQSLHPGRVVDHQGLAALALELPERRLERADNS